MWKNSRGKERKKEIGKELGFGKIGKREKGELSLDKFKREIERAGAEETERKSGRESQS